MFQMIKTVDSQAQTPSARMVVTGFPPFSSVKRNPSDILIRDLSAQDWQPAPDCHVDYILLPMEKQALRKSLDNILTQGNDENIPQIIVHFGVAVQATGFRLERCARNVFQGQSQSAPESKKEDILEISTATSENVTGRMPINTAQEQGHCLNSTLPWEDIQRSLSDAKLPHYMSEDAGTYYCNMVSYLTALTAEDNSLLRSGFVHLPLLVGDEDIAQNCGLKPSFLLSREKILQGAQIILQTCWDKRQNERR